MTKTSGRLTAILGVKGGSGCSLLSALIGRLSTKMGHGRVAVLDGTPNDYSSIPAYLSLPSPSRDLVQLRPYLDQLSGDLLEGFFSRSPEGVSYIPLSNDDRRPYPIEGILPALRSLHGFFDHLILDLSSLPLETGFSLLEHCDKAWVLASPDPSSLAAIRPLEKRLLTRHLSLGNFSLFFNTTQKDSALPLYPKGWAQHLIHRGSIPYCGEGLSLMGQKEIPARVERSLGPLLDALTSQERSKEHPEGGKILHPTDRPEPSDRPSLEAVHQLHQKLLERLRRSGNPEDLSGPAPQRKDLEGPARGILETLLEEMKVPGGSVRQALLQETLDLAFGFGPLETFLQDPSVTEIMVNGPSSIHIEKEGHLEPTELRFHNEVQLRTIIERILAPIGRRIDESQPSVDGRLPDGSRVHAIIPPISLDGPILTIRKFSGKRLGAEDLVRSGALTGTAADFLGACVKARKNIVVSGGTGSGKTTLLNILSSFIPASERIITIEDSAELKLAQSHVVRLESRPSNLEGQGRVTIRDLVINSLRMRPDRIVIGEVRGGEALDMLQAMNTGHDGSLTTVHANSPRDALSRLETMSLFSGLELPLRAVREQISRAVHLVIQQSRLPNGKRGVVKISEVQGMEGEVVVLQDLFERPEGGALLQGPFGPSFLKDLETTGYHWPTRPDPSPK